MRLVILTSRFPYPLEKGDKLRIYHQIKSLSNHHDIVLIATNLGKVSDSQYSELKKYCKEIHVFELNWFQQFYNLFRSLFSALPLQVGLFYTPQWKSRIHEIINSTKPDAIYCHLIRMSEYVKEISTIRKTIDYMDIFSIGMQRRAKVSGILTRAIFNMEYKRLVRYEHNIFDQFDERVIISQQDKVLIPHPDHKKIHVIPNGVDKSQFFPRIEEKKYDLLFPGNMSYPPNVESALFIIEKIIPTIVKQDKNCTVLIAGVNPVQQIRNGASANVHVIDYFENFSDAFACCKIMIAPMLISIGLQNKILQAMAMKMPVVCSTLANNAINAPDGECLLVANTPEEYAEKIMYLKNNPNEANRIGENGYQFVMKNFDWDAANEELAKVILGKG